MTAADMTHGNALVAQTNVQLYNQLLAAGYTNDDLLLVRRAYDLSSKLYSGYYLAEGRPFVAHTVGVASILGRIGSPPTMVAAGLLHNVYGNGDFGDAMGPHATAKRRALVRDVVGDEVERIVAHFPLARLTPSSIDDYAARLDDLEPVDRQAILIDLADFAEKCSDQGVLYSGSSRWVTDVVDSYGHRLIEIAERLGFPVLAKMLEAGFTEVSAAKDRVPAMLQGPADQKYLKLMLPASCGLRWNLRIRTWIRQAWRRRRRLLRPFRFLRPVRQLVHRGAPAE